MIGVYYGTRLYKERDFEIEKGDIGYLPDKDLPERLVKYRLLLKEVQSWEEYIDRDAPPFYNNKQSKIRIDINKETITLIETISNFDKIMNDYLDYVNNHNIFRTNN